MNRLARLAVLVGALAGCTRATEEASTLEGELSTLTDPKHGTAAVRRVLDRVEAERRHDPRLDRPEARQLRDAVVPALVEGCLAGRWTEPHREEALAALAAFRDPRARPVVEKALLGWADGSPAGHLHAVVDWLTTVRPEGVDPAVLACVERCPESVVGRLDVVVRALATPAWRPRLRAILVSAGRGSVRAMVAAEGFLVGDAPELFPELLDALVRGDGSARDFAAKHGDLVVPALRARLEAPVRALPWSFDFRGELRLLVATKRPDAAELLADRAESAPTRPERLAAAAQLADVPVVPRTIEALRHAYASVELEDDPPTHGRRRWVARSEARPLALPMLDAIVNLSDPEQVPFMLSRVEALAREADEDSAVAHRLQQEWLVGAAVVKTAKEAAAVRAAVHRHGSPATRKIVDAIDAVDRRCGDDPSCWTSVVIETRDLPLHVTRRATHLLARTLDEASAARLEAVELPVLSRLGWTASTRLARLERQTRVSLGRHGWTPF